MSAIAVKPVDLSDAHTVLADLPAETGRRCKERM